MKKLKRSFGSSATNKNDLKQKSGLTKTFSQRKTKTVASIKHRKTSPIGSPKHCLDKEKAQIINKNKFLEGKAASKRMTMDPYVSQFDDKENSNAVAEKRNKEKPGNSVESYSSTANKKTFCSVTVSSIRKFQEKSELSSQKLRERMSPKNLKSQKSEGSELKTRNTTKFTTSNTFGLKTKKSYSSIKSSEVSKERGYGQSNPDDDYMLDRHQYRKTMRSGDRLIADSKTMSREQSKASLFSQENKIEQAYYKCETISGRQTECTTAQFRSRERSKDSFKGSEGVNSNRGVVPKKNKIPFYAFQSTKKLTEFKEFKFSERWDKRKIQGTDMESQFVSPSNKPKEGKAKKSIKTINEGIGGVKAFSYIGN